MNNMHRCFLFVLMLLATSAFAESARETVWMEVLSNNVSLANAKRVTEASQTENYVDTHLNDPEVEVGFLWDALDEEADRHTLSVSQELDLSVISGRAKKGANALSEVQSAEYLVEMQNLRNELSQLLDELVFFQRMLSYKKQMLKHLEQVCQWSEKSFKMGETSKLEHNKVRLAFLDMKMSYAKDSLERVALENRLVSLNGGVPLSVDMSSVDYDSRALPMEFDSWFESVVDSIPALTLLKEKEASSEAQLRLATASWWPKVTVGYQSDLCVDEKLRGFNVGMNVPLWANKGRVKSARLNSSAAKEERTATCQQMKIDLRSAYELSRVMKSIYDEMMLVNADVQDSEEMLQKALKVGELSMYDYLLELNMLSDIKEKMIQYEYDYQKSKTDFFSSVQK